jgi:hypothetical protein
MGAWQITASRTIDNHGSEEFVMTEPAVSNKPAQPPKRERLRSFIERHDQLFTMIGALIVFVGFFTKEGVHETTKDLAAALGQAQSAYSIQIELASLQDGIRSIRTDQVYSDRTEDPVGLDDQVSHHLLIVNRAFSDLRNLCTSSASVS